MAYPTTAVEILIASPSDVVEARDVVEAEISDWNRSNAFARRLTLVPVRWERDAVPELGRPPQEILNAQFVRRCDMAIGIFGARFGTPTANAPSGTAEELDLLVHQGKQVAVYFLENAAKTATSEETSRLASYRESLQGRGLYWSVPDEAALAREVRVHLSKAVRPFEVAAASTAPVEILDGMEIAILKRFATQGGTIYARFTDSISYSPEANLMKSRYYIRRLEQRGYLALRYGKHEEYYELTQKGLHVLHQRQLLD